MTTYVALGDSFTAGLVTGEPRWADEVARALGPRTRYENLAWVGATSADVEEKQLDQALSLDPDVVTLVCGANDVLESVRPDPSAYAVRLSRMFERLRSRGAARRGRHCHLPGHLALPRPAPAQPRARREGDAAVQRRLQGGRAAPRRVPA